MAVEGIVIKTEEDCFAQCGILLESEIKKEEDPDWEVEVKLESELMLNADIDNAYSSVSDLPADVDQQCSWQKITSSSEEPTFSLEKIKIKLEQDVDVEVNTGLRECQSSGVGTADRPEISRPSNTRNQAVVVNNGTDDSNEMDKTGTASKDGQLPKYTHSDRKSFLCLHCPDQYKTRKYQDPHLLSHSKRKIFSCDVCLKQFKSKLGLKYHLASHSDQQKTVCKVCSAKCETMRELRQHMLRHSGMKLFVCNECPERFKTSGGLKFHLLYHSGAKSFSCYICLLTYNDRYELAQHIATHFQSSHTSVTCDMCELGVDHC